MIRSVCCHRARHMCLQILTANQLLIKRDFTEKFNMVKNLRKMFDKDKKKKWHKSPMHIQGATPFQGGKGKGVPSEGSRRRAEQVSTVLYTHITSIVNSGELSPELVDMNVDIIKVKMMPDFSSMNVYWMSSGSKKDDELEAVLKKNEGKLRHVLISYHVLGTIPMITFVKDKSAARVHRFEKALATADFGPDFEPGGEGTNIRPNLTTQGEESEEVLTSRFKSLSLDYQDNVDYKDVLVMNETGEIRVPSKSHDENTFPNTSNSKLNFRNDLYGVPHDEIMQRLLMKKHKTKYRTAIEESGSDSEMLRNAIKQEATAVDYNKFAKSKSKPKKGKRRIKSYTLVDHLMDKENANKDWEDEENSIDDDYYQESGLDERK